MKKLISLFFGFMTFMTVWAEVPPLPSCTSCTDSVLNAFWEAPANYEKTEKDTLAFKFQYYAERAEEGVISLGNPDMAWFEISNGTSKKQFWGGKGMALSKLENPYARYFVPVNFQKGENIIHLKARSLSNLPFQLNPIFMEGQDMEALKNKFQINSRASDIVKWLSLLLSFVFLLLALVNFLAFKNHFFKFYILYILVVSILLLIWLDFNGQHNVLFPDSPRLYQIALVFAQQLGYCIYAAFFIHFLDLKNTDRLSFKMLRIYQGLALFMGLFNPLFSYFKEDYLFVLKYLSFLHLIPMFIIIFVLIRTLLVVKNKLKYYVLTATLLIVLFTFAELAFTMYRGGTFVRDYFGPSLAGFKGFNFLQIGLMLELIMFYFGLTHKTLDAERERAAYKAKVIEQLEENEKLEKEVKDLLEKQLEASQKDVVNQKFKREAETNLFKAQLKSIQLQMNPHYFFNSLNSINDFIFDKKPRQASEYLAKYATLMRSVLRNSESIEITLEKEIEHLKVYLDLEKMRFENSFDYEIKHTKDADFLKNKIPLMLIQPLLENAVWHGFKDINYPGKICINFEKNEGGFTIKIDDNGVGLTAKKKPKKTSMGLKLLKEKLAVFNQLNEMNIDFELKNKLYEQGALAVFDIKNKP